MDEVAVYVEGDGAIATLVDNVVFEDPGKCVSSWAGNEGGDAAGRTCRRAFEGLGRRQAF